MSKYGWKRGARIKKLDPEDVAKCLEQTKDKHGAITPENIVKDAKAKTSPIHNYFVWDGDVAAHQYRLVQARELTRYLIIREEDDAGNEIEVRAYHLITEDEEENEYVDAVTVMSDEDMRTQVIARAKKEMIDWRKRYANLLEFSKLFEMIDRIT